MSDKKFIMPSLTLYGIFTRAMPTRLMLEKVNNDCSVVLGFVDKSDAFNYIKTRISEENRSLLLVDVITIESYMDVKNSFEKRHKGGLFALKIIE